LQFGVGLKSIQSQFTRLANISGNAENEEQTCGRNYYQKEKE